MWSYMTGYPSSLCVVVHMTRYPSNPCAVVGEAEVVQQANFSDLVEDAREHGTCDALLRKGTFPMMFTAQGLY